MAANTPAPQPSSAAALAAKIAAEGVYVIESKLYSRIVPALDADRGPAEIAVAGTHGPDGGYKKRVVLVNNGAVPVYLAFAEQELVRGGVPTSATFMLPPSPPGFPTFPPLVLVLQPGQTIWGRSSAAADPRLNPTTPRISVATSVA